MTDATTELLREIGRIGVNRVNLAPETIRSRPWASGTFAGTRHALTFTLEGEAADILLDGLEDREFVLRGHILADIALVSRERTEAGVRIAIEALTIEDC